MRNEYLAHYGVKGMKWGVRKDRKKSPKNRLDSYDSHPVSVDSISAFKSQANTLNRVRTSSSTNGRIYSKNGKLVAMINTEKKPTGEVWIQGLEVFGDNQGKGLGTALVDKAVKDLGATRLSVRKTNKSAKHIYDKYGFKTYAEDDYMYYMNFERNERNYHA